MRPTAYVGFYGLIAMLMKSSMSWDITQSLCLPFAFTLVSCSAYSSTLKMEATCSSKTSVDFQRNTRRYIPDLFRPTACFIPYTNIFVLWEVLEKTDTFLKVCDVGTLLQILCFWTLSIVLFIFQNATFRRPDSVSDFRTSSMNWAQLSRFYLKTETESSLRNVMFWKINRTVFLDKDRTMDNVQNHNILQIFILVSCLIVAILNWHEPPTLHPSNNSVCGTRLYYILSKFVSFENETYKRKDRPTLVSSMGYGKKCAKLKM
jgi:hypothetical protein